MGLLSDINQLTIARGRAVAEGQRNVGMIWANALANLGQIPVQAIQQIQQQKISAQEQQIKSFQLQQLQNAQAGQKRANEIVAGLPRNDDGTFNTPAMLQAFAAKNVPIDEQDRLAKSIDGVNGVISSWNKNKTEHAADLANEILKHAPEGQPITADTVHLGIAAARLAGIANDKDEQRLNEMIASGQDPRTILEHVRGFGSKYNKPEEYQPLPANSPGVMNKTTGVVKPVNVPSRLMNPTELQVAAADPNHPQHQIALDALELGRKAAGGSAEKDDERYRGIQAALLQKQPVTIADRAWAQGYEKQKTLGVDTSASAAAQRQANAIAAQTAQQARAQGFTEAQVGRKELTDKVEQPYFDAREKAETLRSVIEAAKNGNMTAASVQSLLGTLGLVTTEGVKRINTVELENVSGAGSLLERIKGAAGKVVSGQPLSSKLQSDLADLSKVLEQSARQKYERGYKAVTSRYGLKDEKPLETPAESGASPKAAAKVSFTVGEVKALADKTGRTYADVKAEIERQGHIVK